jgi:hypothetical protein
MARRRWLATAATVAAIALLTAQTVLGANPLNRNLFELDKDAADNIVSVRLGTLGTQISNTTTPTSINVCRLVTSEPATPFNILIDGEQMTVTAAAAGSFGGNCAGGTKRAYTVTRPADATKRSNHASAENVTWLNPAPVPDTTAGIDWNTVYAEVVADPTAKCTDLTKVVECQWVPDGRAKSIFTQSKDYDEINTGWKWRDQSVPDADELDDGFAVKFDDGTDQSLFFGADRFAANGTKDAGFWFFHGAVAPLPQVGTADGLFTGTHTAPTPGANGKFCVGSQQFPTGSTTPNCAPYVADDTGGDVLILTSFTGGGAVTTIRVYEWIGPAGTTAALLERGSASDCVPGAGTQLLCATVNDTTITSPWPYSGKGEPQSGAISAGGFMEGGVNLTALGLEGCFSSFMATTRSSASLTADPKDFIFGNFESCSTDIKTTPSDAEGSPLTDSADEDPQDTLPEAQLGTGNAGVDVTDSALIDVKGTSTFSGTLSFFICGPIASGTCDSGGVPAGSQTITADGTYTSDSVNLTEVGRYCWRGVFDIDVEGVPNAVDSSATECFEVLPVTPVLSTTAGADVAVGTAVTDTASLTGTANKPGTNGGVNNT